MNKRPARKPARLTNLFLATALLVLVAPALLAQPATRPARRAHPAECHARCRATGL